MTIQEQIDELYKKIQENIKLMAIPKIIISEGTGIKINITPEPIPENATSFEKIIIETINNLRKLQKCPKCNPDEGGILVLDQETGQWNCVLHKD